MRKTGAAVGVFFFNNKFFTPRKVFFFGIGGFLFSTALIWILAII